MYTNTNIIITLTPLAAPYLCRGSYNVTPAHITGPAYSRGYSGGMMMAKF